MPVCLMIHFDDSDLRSSFVKMNVRKGSVSDVISDFHIIEEHLGKLDLDDIAIFLNFIPIMRLIGNDSILRYLDQKDFYYSLK